MNSFTQIDPVNGFPKLKTVIPPPYNTRITGILPQNL
jgi:hypothetical protein